jgi:hypothetical protein
MRHWVKGVFGIACIAQDSGIDQALLDGRYDVQDYLSP